MSSEKAPKNEYIHVDFFILFSTLSMSEARIHFIFRSFLDPKPWCIEIEKRLLHDAHTTIKAQIRLILPIESWSHDSQYTKWWICVVVWIKRE